MRNSRGKNDIRVGKYLLRGRFLLPFFSTPVFPGKLILGLLKGLVGVVDLILPGISNPPVLQEQHEKHPEHQRHRASSQIEPPCGTAFDHFLSTHRQSESAVPLRLVQVLNLRLLTFETLDSITRARAPGIRSNGQPGEVAPPEALLGTPHPSLSFPL